MRYNGMSRTEHVLFEPIQRIQSRGRLTVVCLLMSGWVVACDSSSNSVNVKNIPDMGMSLKPQDCRINSDCEPGYYCSQGAYCIYDCREDRDCGVGHTCQSGRCLRPGASPIGGMMVSSLTQCNEAEPCEDSWVCVNGECIEHCERIGCPAGRVCEVRTGQCQSVDGCRDEDCPSGRVCEASSGRCVAPVCDESNCAMGTRCDPDTGTCEVISGGCGDETCPVGTYCDRANMMCALLPLNCNDEPCPDGFGCRSSDQRCIPIPDDCRMQACPDGFQCQEPRDQCVPVADCRMTPCPAGTICPDEGGACIPAASCVQVGCVGNERCNEATGQCEMAGQPGALGEPCERSTDCASGICTDVIVEGRRSTICVQLCCGEFNCPIGFGCRDTLGVRFCLPSRLYPPGYSFDARMGQSCGLGGRACQSGECDVAQDRCLGTCCTDDDCGGTACVWRPTSNGLRSLCGLPNLLGQGRTGAPCGDGIDCASGACVLAPTDVSPGQCGDFCCTNTECPNGFVCGQTIDGVGQQIVSVCVPSAGGGAPDGEGCVNDDGCSSGHCVEGVCRSPCCRDAHCQVGHRCLPRPNDEGAFARVCIP